MMKQGVWVPRGQLPEKLTPRQEQIAIALSRDRTTAEVAEELGISAETVITHVRNIYSRLGVHDRISLIQRIIKRGLDK